MKHEKHRHQVIRQDQALDAYLRTLLESVPEAEVDVPVQKKEAQNTRTKSLEAFETTASILEQTAPDANNVAQLPVAVDIDASIKAQNLAVMPAWTQQEFQALFFKVDRLILAAPLTELLRTIKIERAPTKVPGQPSWFLGLLDEHDIQVGVLDTGQLIMGKSKGGQRDLKQHPFQHILITGDRRWGLACDEILSISRLRPDMVRWRTLREKRPWLLGTAIEELTVVIDVAQLVPHRKSRHRDQ